VEWAGEKNSWLLFATTVRCAVTEERIVIPSLEKFSTTPIIRSGVLFGKQRRSDIRKKEWTPIGNEN
jgi:hypothetical protein